MPVLPIIDLLILMGWTSLFGAFALKAVAISTAYRPTLFGLGPFDFVVMAGIFLLFSLALSARAWVKAHESQTFAARERAAATLEAYSAVQAEARRHQGEGAGRGADGASPAGSASSGASQTPPTATAERSRTAVGA